jgi:dihydrofolate synthase/folylpolyglutamate synthase
MTSPDILSSFARFGIHLGLERIHQLLADLGNPQDQVPIIHIAGTNGKGSVCAYLSSILCAAGYKVGRYTSPHLVDWRERICINSEWISSEDLLKAINQVQTVIKPDEMPTQFEVITAAMWWYFAKSEVDIAIIETGLGGRLDATNVCKQPLASVITSISRDHWQRLGDTLGAIASEKAGIIKPNSPVIFGELPPEAAEVIAKKAQDCHAPITWVKPATIKAEIKVDQVAVWGHFEYPLTLLGKHQLMNSAIALATIETLQDQGWEIPDRAIWTGMNQTQWQGRLQWSIYKSTYKSHKILLDGAHNLAAAEYLRQFVDQDFPNARKRWIIGMLDTKDHDGILRSLLQPQDLLFIVPIPNHQSVDLEILGAIANNILETPAYICQSLNAALEKAFSHSDQDSDLVTLCGSLYLVGEFLRSSLK